MARRRHRNARRVVVVNRPRRRARSRNPRSRRGRYIRHHNPRRVRSYRRRHTYSRRYRHNPSRVGGIALTRPMTWLPVLITGGAGATLSSLAPRFVLAADASANQAYVVQLAVAFGGALVLPMLGLRGAHPIAWLVGAAAPIVAHFVTDKVPGWFGLAWYPYQALAQHPAYPPRLYGTDMYPYEGGQEMWTYDQQERSGAPESPFEHMYNN